MSGVVACVNMYDKLIEFLESARNSLLSKCVKWLIQARADAVQFEDTCQAPTLASCWTCYVADMLDNVSLFDVSRLKCAMNLTRHAVRYVVSLDVRFILYKLTGRLEFWYASRQAWPMFYPR